MMFLLAKMDRIALKSNNTFGRSKYITMIISSKSSEADQTSTYMTMYTKNAPNTDA
jgi:hypothetical protein